MSASSSVQQNAPATIPRAAARLGGYLATLADESDRDRGKLAALRRGLGEPDGWHPQLANVVNPSIHDVPDHKAPIFYKVAALFGLHPVARRSGDNQPSGRLVERSFTHALHQYALQRSREGGGSIDDIKKPLDRRVMALLNADTEDVFHHLRYATSLLRGSDIPVDWVRLIIDLDRWDLPDREVQRRWSRAWWPAPGWADESAPAPGIAAEPASGPIAAGTAP
jgi:CRISPR system Cascade subunit CasB